MASFVASIQASPSVFDKAAAESCLAAGGAPSGAAADLLAAAAGGAPFLGRTAKRDAEWLSGIWSRQSDQVWTELEADVRSAGSLDVPEAEAMRVMRVARRRAALLAALADLGGVWHLDHLTAHLTRFADVAVGAALDRLIHEEAATGRMPSLEPSAPALFALAMGKMGAGELNYSSDIDLILLYDPERLAPSDRSIAKERFPRMARKFVKLLSEVTADGYVARVDLRLRPDPGATPLVIATDAAERYYEGVGRTWERAAHIKARVAAGDQIAGSAYLEAMQPFVWRRNLDFAALEETAGILAKIRAAKGGAEIAVRGQDVKLGAGGIREIEFYAQTQQLMLGGRDPSLRGRRTRDALRALEAAERISEGTRRAMDGAYAHLRKLEHRLQMIEDRQTHRMPEDDAELERVAVLMGCADFAELEGITRPHMVAVRTVSSMLDQRSTGEEQLCALDEAIAALPDPEAARRIVEIWLAGRYRAMRSERARSKLERLAPEFLRRLAAATDPMGALLRFDRFLSSLPAGVQLFSLFEETPALLDLVTEITALAPRLAHVMASRARVLDAVLDPGFFEPPSPVASLQEELSKALAGAGDDYEEALDETRRWAAERRFQIGVALLRGALSAERAAAAYSDVADACLAALYPKVEAEMERRHGAPPGVGATVFAMGNLGSRELTATSDIDMIVIYDAELGAMSEPRRDGARALPAAQYYARLTQTLTSAISAPTSEGALYEVDMRLRPSGNAGPLATSLDAFRRYQAEDAWVWEHMALTRARAITGAPSARSAAEDAVREALGREREAAVVLRAAAEMRARLDEAHRSDAARLWALKHGHGGLIDAEFVGQAGLLAAGAAAQHTMSTPQALAYLADVGVLSVDEGRDMTDAHAFVFALHQMRRLAMEPPFDMGNAGAGLRRVLERATGAQDFATLEERLAAAKRTIRRIYDQRIAQT